MKKIVIKNLFGKLIQPHDRIIIYLIIMGFFCGLVTMAINALTYQFTGNHYVPSAWLALSPFILCLLIFSWRTLHITPRIAFFTKTYCLFFFIIACEATLMTGVQYTPFPTIDKLLVAADRFIGFDTLSIMDWTYAHHSFATLMWFSYNSWIYQIVAIPLIFGILNDYKAINLFFVSFLISVLIGSFIYYFLPTAAPSSIFSTPHFDIMQLATSLKFYEIHHYQIPSTSSGGMIAMPSFHVTCALLLLYACRLRTWLLLALLPFNFLIILSTVCLGWHYLMDVIAAFFLVAVSIYLANCLLNKCDLVTKET